MSLSRTALRLATLEALRPTASIATDGPWPTLAGAAVFDSRVDPIDDMAPAERQPVVCVYTEHDEGSSSQRAGGPPFRQIVDLVLELSVVVRVDDGADPATYDAGIPETDAELEASLDLLEAQIKFALLYGPAGALWRKVTGRKVTDPRSVPHRTSEEAVRLARRTVTWKCQVLDDCFEAAPPADPVGLDRLPQPLRGVLAELAATAYGRKIGLGLAAVAPVMPVRTPFARADLNVKGADPSGAVPAEPNLVASVDLPQG